MTSRSELMVLASSPTRSGCNKWHLLHYLQYLAGSAMSSYLLYSLSDAFCPNLQPCRGVVHLLAVLCRFCFVSAPSRQLSILWCVCLGHQPALHFDGRFFD